MARYQGSSDTSSDAPQLSYEVSYRLGCPVIYVRGEFDHRTAGILREAIDGELANGTQVMLLDFADLAYMDSGGLGALFDAVQRFKRPGWLGVIAPNPGVSRLVEITGLAEHPCFRLLPDLTAAAAVLGTAESANS